MDSRKLTLSTMHSQPEQTDTLAYKSSKASSQELPAHLLAKSVLGSCSMF